MIGWLVIALAIWVILLPLWIWLVSWIARCGISPTAGNVKVQFVWKPPVLGPRREPEPKL